MGEKTLNKTEQQKTAVTKSAVLPPAQKSLSTLAVPKSPQKGGNEADITAYDIKAGDTLSAVAKKYGMALSDLQKLNPNVVPTKMEVGDRIFVKAPEANAAPANSLNYYIHSGDTFEKIAKRYGTSVRAIVGLNPKADPTKLKEGQRILIPCSPSASQAQPAPAQVSTEAHKVEAQNPANAQRRVTPDVNTAFKTLSELQKKVEGEGRIWVVSQKSRPNPEAVKAINDLLNAAGAEPPLSGNVFTARTFEALKSFQSANGLNTDGKFGSAVLEAFRYSLSPVRSNEDFISISTRTRSDGLDEVRQGRTVLRWDSKFDGKDADRAAFLAAPKDADKIAQIRNLQNLLNDAGAWPIVETSGIFDAQTKKAVMNFQRSQKLPADGSVGQDTVKALDMSREKYIFALKRVLGEEGGISDNKNDRGGLTFRGVTQGTYDNWRDRHHLAQQTVTSMSPLEARALYRELYWLKAYCDQCPRKIATVVFDCAVNCGVGTARDHLHQVCESANISVGDLRSMEPKKQRELGRELITLRRAHHDTIVARDKSQEGFAKGWTNRINRLLALVESITDTSST